MDQIRRKCGSIVRVNVYGFTLYALRSSLVGGKKSLTVIAYDTYLPSGQVVAVAMDAKLLEIPMRSLSVQLAIKACFDGTLAEKPATFNSYERPTLMNEIHHVYAHVRGIEPKAKIIKSLITYDHPLCGEFGGRVLEWTV